VIIGVLFVSFVQIVSYVGLRSSADGGRSPCILKHFAVGTTECMLLNITDSCAV